MTTSRIDRNRVARGIAGCALALSLAACEPPGETNGMADYILDNRTDRSLTIHWVTTPGVGSGGHQAGPVPAGHSLRFQSDGIIGVTPMPLDTFESLHLADAAGNVVYRQEPIDNHAWVFERTDDSNFGHANVTLVVTETLLGPDYGLPAGHCCCELVREGDILAEDALPVAECLARPQGTCIVVDPDRLTPHPCCPDATGERCRDGA